MDAAAVNPSKPAASELLLAHCRSLESAESRGPTASLRLEAALGSELARRLVAALSPVR